LSEAGETPALRFAAWFRWLFCLDADVSASDKTSSLTFWLRRDVFNIVP